MSRSITQHCRRAIRLAHLNAFAWSLGNGLATTTLVTYLAAEYGAKGLFVSLILAAPTVIGLLRQAAPQLIFRFGSRKEFCLAAYTLSAFLLYMLPLISAPGVLPNRSLSLIALVMLWCGYQATEYFGTVALWSWLGDVAPQPVRGRFLGVRERWLSLGRLLGMLISGGLSLAWPWFFPRELLWVPYAGCALCGALVMGGALLPLVELSALERTSSSVTVATSRWWQRWSEIWCDRNLRPLVIFGCWLGAVNGLLQASQFFYGRNVLGLSLLVVLTLRSETEIGQTAFSPALGRMIDRLGNRLVMIGSQLAVASALLFYLFATRQTWWIVTGAWTMFIAYAGLNIGIPNLLIRLSPAGDSRNQAIASYYAWAGLAYGLGSLAGGQLFDWAARLKLSLYFGAWRFDHFALFFVAGCLLRALGALWIAQIPENRELKGE